MKSKNKTLIITILFAVWFTLYAAWFYYWHRYLLAFTFSAVVVAWLYWVSLLWRERRR